jgi:hypothetical protein
MSLLAGMPALSHAEVDEGLLQRLFRLIRPSGTYEGRLSDVLAKATQRSGIADTLPRVLLVDHRTGGIVEWVRGRGAVEPVVCPDGRTLVVRRGTRIERTEITIANGQAIPPGGATPVPDILVRQIFGCAPVPGEDATTWDLWVENTAGEFLTVRLSKGTASVGVLPDAFRSDPPRDAGLALRRLQGIRTDGLSAMVRDAKLVVERYNATGTSSGPLPVQMPVTGDPAWLGDTDWIVVTGLQN